jgi:hypothetical protein
MGKSFASVKSSKTLKLVSKNVQRKWLQHWFPDPDLVRDEEFVESIRPDHFSFQPIKL